eukprot:COSAG02_NODE_19015_length_905_cov_1.207196_2_plen_93_part_00
MAVAGECTRDGVRELGEYWQTVLVQIALNLSMGFPASYFLKRGSCALCAKHVSFTGVDPRSIDASALRSDNWDSVESCASDRDHLHQPICGH